MSKRLIKTILKEIAVRHVPNNPEDAFESGLDIGKKEKLEIGYAQSDMINKFSPETAMGIGYDAGRLGLDDHEYDKEVSFHCPNSEIFEDWVGIRQHAMAPHEESYRKVGDMLAMNPDVAYQIIQPLLDASGATCVVSAAKAMSDILELIASHKQ